MTKAVAGLLAAALLILAVLVAMGDTSAFDTAILKAVAFAGDTSYWRAALFVTVLGGTPAILAAMAVVSLLLLRSGEKRTVLLQWAGFLGARIATDGLKLLMARPRPADLTDPDRILAAATSASFPSGHTTSAVYVFGFLILVMLESNAGPFIKRGSVALLVLLVVAVASSRLLLGVHYPSDILGGALSGGIMLAFVSGILKSR